MAALLGRIEEFDGTMEEWPQYVERVGHFFSANAITEGAKKRSIFLSLIGPSTYKLLRNLLAPTKPGDMAYEDLVKTLSAHYCPTPSKIVWRHKFYSRSRKSGETVATFVSELRSIAEYCNFGATLDVMLRDRLVCGINNSQIQKRLLSEKDLKYQNALELALGIEAAALSLKELSLQDAKQVGEVSTPPQDEREVHRIVPLRMNKRSKNSPSKSCYRCGKLSHSASNCRFREAVCYNCGKKGHISSVCRSRSKLPQQSSRPSKPTGQVSHGRSKQRNTHRVQEIDSTTSDKEAGSGDEYRLLMMTDRSSSDSIMVQVTINGKKLTMELDTGAAVSIISDRTRRSMFPDLQLRKSSLTLRTYTDEPMRVVVNLMYESNMEVKRKSWFSLLWEEMVQVFLAGTGSSTSNLTGKRSRLFGPRNQGH